MKTKLFKLFILSVISLYLGGCATASINYDKDTKILTLTNTDEISQMPNITLAKDKYKGYITQRKGNSTRTTYIVSKNKSCKIINVFKYHPLSHNRYYESSVLDDLKKRYKGYKIEKYGRVYAAKNSHRGSLAFETHSTSGVDSKTYIDANIKCIKEFTNQNKKSKKSIWHKPVEVFEN